MAKKVKINNEIKETKLDKKIDKMNKKNASQRDLRSIFWRKIRKYDVILSREKFWVASEL